MTKRQSFSREFKLEAVRLVHEQNMTVAQAARDLDEPFPLADPEENVLEGLPVAAAEEQIRRVRRDVERRGLEAVVLLVHG